MKEIFADMFALAPDKIENGDYYYRVPWIEREQRLYGDWVYSDEALERFEKRSKAVFRSVWEKRTFDGDFDEARDYHWLKTVKGADKSAYVTEIFAKIARDNTPFMDIASSEAMGIASYILKLNPKTPCLVTDIDEHNIRRLHSRIGENLPGYDISLASFDNLDMPLADGSIECVTSMGAIMHSNMNRSWSVENESDPNVTTFADFGESCRRRAIAEVYRILKPGGIFITAEGEWDWEYDARTIDDHFSSHDKLYGLYTRERVYERISEFEEQKAKYALCDDKFTSAGFTVEFERRYKTKCPLDIAAISLSETGDPVTVEDGDRTEGIIDIYDQHILYILRKPL